MFVPKLFPRCEVNPFRGTRILGRGLHRFRVARHPSKNLRQPGINIPVVPFYLSVAASFPENGFNVNQGFTLSSSALRSSKSLCSAVLIPFVEQPPGLSRKHAELVEIPPTSQPRGVGGQRR